MNIENRSLTSYFYSFIKKQKGLFLLTQLMALAWSISNVIEPYFLGKFVDALSNYQGDKNHIWPVILPILGLWIGIWLMTEVMFRAQGFLLARFQPRFLRDIRMHMLSYVTGHSYNYFANQFAGTLGNKIQLITSAAERIVTLILTLFVPTFIALLIACGILLFLHPMFALVLIVWVCLHMGVCLGARNYLSNKSALHARSLSFLNGKIVDTFTNIINVKLFNRRKFENNYISPYQDDEQEKNQESIRAVERVRIVLGILGIAFPGLLMTYLEIVAWQKGYISLGEVVFIIHSTINILIMFWIVGMELPNFFKDVGIARESLKLVQEPYEIANEANGVPLELSDGAIDFKDVSFSYIPEQALFDQLNVHIAPKSKVGLVGFSGSGKSSFIHLIMRFYDINSGQIKIDGQAIDKVDLDSLRSKISMIPQTPSLFHRNIRENICYGKPDATEEEIQQVAKWAHVEEFVSLLPHGYDTQVGERGVKLSGGQRQRIAIARAMLNDAPILILDEATSALDSITEKLIHSALMKLMENRTTIIIAHRLSTLAEVDQILVFDKGKVIESGSQDELLKQKGHYYKLWEMQSGGFIPDERDELSMMDTSPNPDEDLN